MIFTNRVEAGNKLALKLLDYADGNTLVLAVPRGGVVVGYEVARKVRAPLDVIVPRKIGAPNNPELAIGAVTENGTTILDHELIAYLNVSERYIKEESDRQRSEIRRRLRLYRGNSPPPIYESRNIIIVDDGIATGATIKAAIASIRKKKPKSIIIAVPVAPPSTVKALEKEADRVICLSTPQPFYAIGQFYKDFSQTSDEEVIKLLELNREHLRVSHN
jgi:predicted phosphoribosyltransferase